MNKPDPLAELDKNNVQLDTDVREKFSRSVAAIRELSGSGGRELTPREAAVLVRELRRELIRLEDEFDLKKTPVTNYNDYQDSGYSDAYPDRPYRDVYSDTYSDAYSDAEKDKPQ